MCIRDRTLNAASRQSTIQETKHQTIMNMKKQIQNLRKDSSISPIDLRSHAELDSDGSKKLPNGDGTPFEKRKLGRGGFNSVSARRLPGLGASRNTLIGFESELSRIVSVESNSKIEEDQESEDRATLHKVSREVEAITTRDPESDQIVVDDPKAQGSNQPQQRAKFIRHRKNHSSTLPRQTKRTTNTQHLGRSKSVFVDRRELLKKNEELFRSVLREVIFETFIENLRQVVDVGRTRARFRSELDTSLDVLTSANMPGTPDVIKELAEEEMSPEKAAKSRWIEEKKGSILQEEDESPRRLKPPLHRSLQSSPQRTEQDMKKLMLTPRLRPGRDDNKPVAGSHPIVKSEFALKVDKVRSPLDRYLLKKDQTIPEASPPPVVSIFGKYNEMEKRRMLIDLVPSALRTLPKDNLPKQIDVRLRTHKRTWAFVRLPLIQKVFRYAETPRILLVDDSSFYLRSALTISTSIQKTIVTADDGTVAVERYKKEMETGNLFHMIILDMQMVKMGGLEAARHIRKLEKEGGIPKTFIIGHSCDDEKDVKASCLEAGMDDFSKKPLTPEQLVKFIERSLEMLNGHLEIHTFIDPNVEV
eukprot:TRINITY_DN9296_c0_g2_i1.p1 TRINITY_DN9296_c0_g2~~TRINITY_DN9296_c0_g2_i1.p1  ORF type:complete len:609 (+),score=142.26 TRINITY_DN9296_c0_g2_i1:62-1828(+)